MKQKIINAIVGWLGGIGGALIFEPIDGITDVLFSDYAIGGIIIGIVASFLGKNAASLQTKIIYNVLVGLAVFLVLGLLAGSLGTDLIAGLVIGLLVALSSHYLSDDVQRMVDKTENIINKNS